MPKVRMTVPQSSILARLIDGERIEMLSGYSFRLAGSKRILHYVTWQALLNEQWIEWDGEAFCITDAGRAAYANSRIG